MFARTASQGVTLVELVVTVAVLAILAAIALPSFQATIRSNRMATSANELVSSIALARSEAIRNARGSGICPTTDGQSCGDSWNDGWLVWSDESGGTVGAFDPAGDTVVRHVEGRVQPTITAAVSGGTATEIGFDGRGRPSVSGLPLSWKLRPDHCPSGADLQRRVEVTLAGQIKTLKENCE